MKQFKIVITDGKVKVTYYAYDYSKAKALERLLKAFDGWKEVRDEE